MKGAEKIKKFHLDHLIEKVAAAVKLGDSSKITNQIKDDLEELIKSGELEIPAELKTPRKECYARRLLHQDPKLGFVMVAMTWGPGQGTAIHDHDGIWCVEGVLEGKMTVMSYDIQEKKGDLYRLVKVQNIKTGVGEAGALIPPHDHHLLANALTSTPSVTLHVYGGEIDRCSAFIEEGKGWYRREIKTLTYHN